MRFTISKRASDAITLHVHPLWSSGSWGDSGLPWPKLDEVVSDSSITGGDLTVNVNISTGQLTLSSSQPQSTHDGDKLAAWQQQWRKRMFTPGVMADCVASVTGSRCKKTLKRWSGRWLPENAAATVKIVDVTPQTIDMVLQAQTADHRQWLVAGVRIARHSGWLISMNMTGRVDLQTTQHPQRYRLDMQVQSTDAWPQFFVGANDPADYLPQDLVPTVAASNAELSWTPQQKKQWQTSAQAVYDAAKDRLRFTLSEQQPTSLVARFSDITGWNSAGQQTDKKWLSHSTWGIDGLTEASMWYIGPGYASDMFKGVANLRANVSLYPLKWRTAALPLCVGESDRRQVSSHADDSACQNVPAEVNIGDTALHYEYKGDMQGYSFYLLRYRRGLHDVLQLSRDDLGTYFVFEPFSRLKTTLSEADEAYLAKHLRPDWAPAWLSRDDSQFIARGMGQGSLFIAVPIGASLETMHLLLGTLGSAPVYETSQPIPFKIVNDQENE